MKVVDASSGSGKWYYYEKNLRGDIVGIMNADGYKVVSYSYDAWGVPYAPVYSTDSVVSAADKANAELNPFRYRGYYYDSETGYYYLQTRYYNPEWGRFINADGYINANGDILGYNMFAYCSNNPVNNVDPSGQWYIKDGIKWISRNILQPATDAVKYGMEKLCNGTQSAGISLSGAFLGIGGSISVGLAKDNQGKVGFFVSGSLLGGSPNFSVSAFQSVTNAPTVDDLGGISGEFGGSLDVSGVSIGGEVSVFSNKNTNDIYYGGTVSAGIGAPIPMEIHAGISTSKIWSFSIFDELNKVYNKLNAW